jgi:hypothetical protein
MHRLVASGNPVLHALHDYMVRLDPGPHKATMLKRFHRESRAEFCSACHKVHLDVPVNHYRWFRGFDEYDAWQGSGVSGQGARAFYYPDKPKDCGDCHMPLVASRDAGNRDAKVHSHRFPAANTAVPFANHDEAQLRATQDFLQANIVTVDIFAASEAEPAPVREGVATPAAGRRVPPVAVESAEPRAATMVPEMAEPPPAAVAGIAPAQPGTLQAPLDRAASASCAPAEPYRVDVARTRRRSQLPGGTVDAFDVWLSSAGRTRPAASLF